MSKMFVYEALGEIGEVLYVGSTNSLRNRMVCHKSGYKAYNLSQWWPIHVAVRVSVVEGRANALELERKLVEAHMPPHNKVVPPKKSGELEGLPEVSWADPAYLRHGEAARLVGLTHYDLQKLRRKGKFIEPDARCGEHACWHISRLQELVDKEKAVPPRATIGTHHRVRLDLITDAKRSR